MTPAVLTQIATLCRTHLRRAGFHVRRQVPWPERGYLVHPTAKFIYCPLQKIACSSLMRWFLETQGFAAEQIHDVHEQVTGFQLGQLPPTQAVLILNDESYFRFAFVRNPWARLVSAYLNLLVRRHPVAEPILHDLQRRGIKFTKSIPPFAPTNFSFEEFLQYLARTSPRTYNVHWKPQHLFLERIRLDFVGRFERLADDFEVVRQRLGTPQRLARINSTHYLESSAEADEYVGDWLPPALLALPAQPQYPRFYTKETRQLVARIYARDVETFGYQFES
jgi:hypothetical protein